jgi:WD40 repeat protein
MLRKCARYRMIIPLLATLLLSTIGCGEVQDHSYGLTPTLTPIPPAPTTIPLTPTTTPVPPTPTPDLSPITAAVLSEQGIPEAAHYDPDGPGPHRLLVLTDSGSAHEWNELLPANWGASSVNEIELVVLAYPEREIELDTHSYVGGPPITRYRFELDVEVLEARTGSIHWKGTLKGSMPGDFPQTAPVDQTRITGSSVSWADLEEWLSCRFSAPQQCDCRVLEGHSFGVGGVAFSPDGQTLASGSDEVRLWRVSDSATLRAMAESGGKVTFSPDGQTLATWSEDGVRLWRVSDGTLLRTLEASQVTSMSFSPDGQILATGGWDESFVRLWRVSDGTLLRTLEGSGRCVTFSPDGQMLASGSRDENIVRLWRVSDGTLLQELEGHKHPVASVAFSPDGQTLASGSSDLYVHLWRVSDGALLHKLFGHSNSVLSVAFSPDGGTLASGSADHNVHLWRVSDGTLLQELQGHTDLVTSVAFSPDGLTLASGSFDHTVRLWRIE